MKPDPALLEKLAGSRFVAEFAKPSVGVGERRSGASGAGLEFSNYRPYREGDDVRHLDQRVRARLGRDYVRQYAEDRQLPIVIVIDGSASMAHGSPDKFRFALALAQLLGFIGLAPGDRVQIVLSAEQGLAWSPKWQGLARADAMFDWIGNRILTGRVPFEEAIAPIPAGIAPASLVLLISDLWTGDIGRLAQHFAEYRHQLLAIHVETADEVDPSLLGMGPIRLVDAESGDALELVVDDRALLDYQAARAEWTDQIRTKLARWGGQYIQTNATQSLSDLALRALRQRGIIV